MNVPRVRRVDWRGQMIALEAFLNDRGGVIEVAAAGRAPSATFAKVVRQAMAERSSPRPWTSVQIDMLDPNTHYLEDVVVQLERSLEVPDLPPHAAGGMVQVATNIHAETVTVSDVHISYEEDGFERSARATSRLQRLGEHVAERLEDERVALLFLDSHLYAPHTLARFRSRLWDPHLAPLVERGLLLIDISDPASRPTPEWPPDPDKQLELPERFYDDAETDAIEDLAAIALSEGAVSTAEAAHSFAVTLIAACGTVGEVHARLAGVLLRLRGPRP
jgi:hypothetical protein